MAQNWYNIVLCKQGYSSNQFTIMKEDSRFGYVIIVCSFVVNLISMSYFASCGVYYVEFLEYFQSSKMVTSWIITVHIASFGIGSKVKNIESILKVYGICNDYHYKFSHVKLDTYMLNTTKADDSLIPRKLSIYLYIFVFDR